MTQFYLVSYRRDTCTDYRISSINAKEAQRYVESLTEEELDSEEIMNTDCTYNGVEEVVLLGN